MIRIDLELWQARFDRIKKLFTNKYTFEWLNPYDFTWQKTEKRYKTFAFCVSGMLKMMLLELKDNVKEWRVIDKRNNTIFHIKRIR